MIWDTGRYLVKTESTTYVWDMNAGTITCKRIDRDVSFIGDGEELKIKEVHMWPVIGQQFYVVVQVPSSGDFQWRESSVVQDVEELQ